MTYRLIRLLVEEAAPFIAKYHRHSKPLKRHKFTIGAIDSFTNELVGICTVDTPSSKLNRFRDHVEIRRVCTINNNKNAASFLIGHACTACFSMGYTTIISYTQPHESGISLLASGFEVTRVATLTFNGGDDFEGGLITWKKYKDYKFCPEVRQRSKQWIKKRHEFIEKHKSKK
jgi:hypothetical protein